MDSRDGAEQNPDDLSESDISAGSAGPFSSEEWGLGSSIDWSQIPDYPDTSIEENPTSKYALHPDDRIWRHPSELQYLSPDARALGRRSSIRRLIGSGLIGAIIGAVVAALVVGNMLSDSDPVIERVVE